MARKGFVMVFLKLLFLSTALLWGGTNSTVAHDRPQAVGKASWYAVKCNGGRRTASGERLDETALTAAHKSLPFGTVVKVENLTTGQSVQVRINDRGPYKPGRVIDLTKGAFKRIGELKKGIVDIRLEVLSLPEEKKEA